MALCTFPKQARYSLKGDVNDAAWNLECAYWRYAQDNDLTVQCLRCAINGVIVETHRKSSLPQALFSCAGPSTQEVKRKLLQRSLGTPLRSRETSRDLAANHESFPHYMNRAPPIIQLGANGCILESRGTPSAAPAMSDGSCATRHTSRRPSMMPGCRPSNWQPGCTGSSDSLAGGDFRLGSESAAPQTSGPNSRAI